MISYAVIPDGLVLIVLTACKGIPVVSVLRYPDLPRLLSCICSVKSVSRNSEINSVSVRGAVVYCLIEFINNITAEISERRDRTAGGKSLFHLRRTAVGRVVGVLARCGNVFLYLCANCVGGGKTERYRGKRKYDCNNESD